MKPLTRKQVAERCGVCERTVDRWIAEGKLIALKYARAVRIDGDSFKRFQDKARAHGTNTFRSTQASV